MQKEQEPLNTDAPDTGQNAAFPPIAPAKGEPKGAPAQTEPPKEQTPPPVSQADFEREKTARIAAQSELTALRQLETVRKAGVSDTYVKFAAFGAQDIVNESGAAFDAALTQFITDNAFVKKQNTRTVTVDTGPQNAAENVLGGFNLGFLNPVKPVDKK